MELHEKIRSIRKLKGWSQEEIAAKLEMSSNGYGSIERGGTDVNLSRLISIAELFDMTLQELMSFDSSDASNSASNITNGTISPLNHRQSETHAKMQFELEKQKLMLEIANQKITTQDFEIEKLTKIIAIMKDEIKVLKGQ
jgi:transcriptional regulator with XRE-family HTH domain